MTLYFAYGLNLDRPGMARRCPRSRVIGPAQLPDHRFGIVTAGYASVLPTVGATVHGLLWEIDPVDWSALDAFEEVEAGLYARTARPVSEGGRSRSADLYMAADQRPGSSRPGYMEQVVAAAASCGLPPGYLDHLRTWLEAA